MAKVKKDQVSALEMKQKEIDQYPVLLMKTLEAATQKLNFELFVVAGLFRVEDRNDRNASNYMFGLNHTEASQSELVSLAFKVDKQMEEKREREERAEKKLVALNKLTKEERELLGL